MVSFSREYLDSLISSITNVKIAFCVISKRFRTYSRKVFYWEKANAFFFSAKMITWASAGEMPSPPAKFAACSNARADKISTIIQPSLNASAATSASGKFRRMPSSTTSTLTLGVTTMQPKSFWRIWSLFICARWISGPESETTVSKLGLFSVLLFHVPFDAAGIPVYGDAFGF